MPNAQIILTERPRLRAGVWTLLAHRTEPPANGMQDRYLNQRLSRLGHTERAARPKQVPQALRDVITEDGDEQNVTHMAECCLMTTPAQAEVRLVCAQGINLVDGTVPGLGK